jgi:hypothetical protein
MRDGRVVGVVARSDLIHGLLARQTGHVPSDDDDQLKLRFGEELGKADVESSLLNYVVCGGVIHIWGVVRSTPQMTAIRIAARSTPGIQDICMHVQALGPELQRAMRE